MNIAPPAAPAERITLYHRRHARQQVGKSFGHFGPAVVLLFGIAPVLSGEESFTALRALEVLIGAAYLALMVREWVHLRHHPHHREPVAWLELAAAAILALESYHIWHRHHEAALAGHPHKTPILPLLYAGTAVMFAVMAFRMKEMDGRRFLHLHGRGFALRTNRLGRKHELRWAEVAAVEPDGPADVLVRCTNGRARRISFAHLHEGAAHRDRLLAHAAAQLDAAPAAD
ncbi:hypothetical protein [Hymenobacter armeniacus]|uniref:PH domain-containing protein n=1 Tax=Hymenobacter armeniacus TaxID=2771358 RepID=A0ABR8JKI5_9BACT|nr:hypothetical protein [Hymenobacter armeniacus]MBD2720529.1 hypothetical protein [Hymenobacter armeniacus]